MSGSPPSSNAVDVITPAGGPQSGPPSPSSSSTSPSPFSGESFLWIITPLLLVVLLGWLCVAFKCRRDRRRRRGYRFGQDWLPAAERRPYAPAQPSVALSSLRRGTGTAGSVPAPTAAASEPGQRRDATVPAAVEGLNELGEAPPPYQPKKEADGESLPPDYGSEAAVSNGHGDTDGPGDEPSSDVIARPPRAALASLLRRDGAGGL